MVYDDAEKLYAEVRKDAEDLIEEAYGALLPKSVAQSNVDPIAGSGIRLVGYNTTPFPRRDIIELPASEGRINVIMECPEGSHVAHPIMNALNSPKDGAFGASVNRFQFVPESLTRLNSFDERRRRFDIPEPLPSHGDLGRQDQQPGGC